eukprot:CAMPEP_0170523840 /NCGR_PEP_ID=MMETSP0209-20121228/9277_1 /TAXON_ID=665100 ORGANISM="Litonotus pictus, Strain P1" /NCGR_SAMPLE_ID=MMETSP0209 /ASSEMBLY_ACC=CAM_ASM_000301 /LENGTH=42 /DNA_ID= /DNA_START= /DNA_END= /DNA_ORIENTATION=
MNVKQFMNLIDDIGLKNGHSITQPIMESLFYKYGKQGAINFD